MAALFRWLSRRCFGRPLADFTLDGALGQARFDAYCAAVFEEAITDKRAPATLD